MLDEPFNGPHRTASKTLSNLLIKLASEGRLIIASHHNMNTAKSLFNQVLMLNTETVSFGYSEEIINEDMLEKTLNTASTTQD
ncbi:MAG: hypothetical protein QS721_13775 [Candidatus Endonucleobacter sp. (ex Gigantidas childressi)]|nr:hypothetical protein [Candidatus Endonucleobacter sp. (ex Gigantidas childressi)]